MNACRSWLSVESPKNRSVPDGFFRCCLFLPFGATTSANAREKRDTAKAKNRAIFMGESSIRQSHRTSRNKAANVAFFRLLTEGAVRIQPEDQSFFNDLAPELSPDILHFARQFRHSYAGGC